MMQRAEQNLAEWQTAISCLIGAAKGRDFLMMRGSPRASALSVNLAQSNELCPSWPEGLVIGFDGHQVPDRGAAVRDYRPLF
jgi:hypothetical protein